MIWLLAHPPLPVSSTSDRQETQKEIQIANHTVANKKFVKHVCLLSSHFILVCKLNFHKGFPMYELVRLLWRGEILLFHSYTLVQGRLKEKARSGLASPIGRWLIYMYRGLGRGSQRDVVNLGWPISPKHVWGGGGGVSAVHMEHK